MKWIVTNLINKTKRTFDNKTDAQAFCKKTALEYMKAQKLLGIRRKVGYTASIATCKAEDMKHGFDTSVRATVLTNEGVPTKWKILFD